MPFGSICDGFSGNAFASSGVPPAPPPPPPVFNLAPDPFATGQAPTIPFPSSFSAQALPANTPPWQASGNMVAPNSALLVANFVSQYTSQFGAVYANQVCPRYIVNIPAGTLPGGQLGPAPTARTWNFNPGGVWDASPQGTYPVNCPPPTTTVPTGYVCGSNTDHEVAMWDWGANLTTSFWGNYTTNGGGSGQTVPVLPPESNTGQLIGGGDTAYPGFGAGSVSGLSTSTSAIGQPYISTVITWADYLFGAIKHMLFCTTGNPTGAALNPVPEADGVDSLTILAGGIPEGTIFVMPKSVAMPNFVAAGSNAPLFAAMVFTALQNYGMIVGDSSAGGGIGVACEGYFPWAFYSPTLFPHGYPPYWMFDLETAPFGEGAFVGMPWSSMVAIEPSTLYSPLMTDNNGTPNTTLLDTQAFEVTAATTSLTLKAATSSNDMLVISGELGQAGANGAIGNLISGLGGTWVKQFENVQTWATDSSVRAAFCYVGYGCTAGNTVLTTTFTAPGQVAISRWSRTSASNPIVAASTPTGNTTMAGPFTSGSVTATAANQLVIGLFYIGYVENFENAFGAVSELNYAGSSWSNGKFNRHIVNGINVTYTNSTFQNCIVPTASGAVTCTFKTAGFTGWGTWMTEVLVLSP